jgi:hypothetical protein
MLDLDPPADCACRARGRARETYDRCRSDKVCDLLVCPPSSPKVCRTSTAYLKLDGNGASSRLLRFSLKVSTPTPKSAQLASRAPARAELGTAWRWGKK